MSEIEMNDELVMRLRSGLDNVDGNEFGGIILRMNEAADEIIRLHTALAKANRVIDLALEYWAHRQQRYKNRHPEWVQAAKEWKERKP